MSIEEQISGRKPWVEDFSLPVPRFSIANPYWIPGLRTSSRDYLYATRWEWWLQPFRRLLLAPNEWLSDLAFEKQSIMPERIKRLEFGIEALRGGFWRMATMNEFRFWLRDYVRELRHGGKARLPEGHARGSEVRKELAASA
ncbi:MAG: hypothetical protein ACRD8A_12730 [Candidatus Acidiferrales bacterium]